MSESKIEQTIGDKRYILKGDLSGVFNMNNINGVLYINGIEAPTKEGEYKLNNIPGCVLVVKKAKKKANVNIMNNVSISGNFVGGVVRNNFKECKVGGQMYMGDCITENIRTKKASTKNNYKIEGCGQVVKDKNIVVYGNIQVQGMNNTVFRGTMNAGFETVIIKGNLIVQGMNNIVGNIVELYGNVMTEGMNNRVV